LVTGGTGFVGSHVARALHEAGHEVRVLHRHTSKLAALDGIPFDSAFGDVTDEAALNAACADCDWVIHVAAVADYWRQDAGHLMHVNVDGTRYALNAARRAGVRRFIFTSSAAAMGIKRDDSIVDETVRFNLSPVRFPYGYSKALAEIHALEAAQNGLDVVIVNPVVVLGPGDLNRISGEFILNIKRLGWLMPVPAGGIAVTDVRDVARWNVAAAQHGRTGERYLLNTANYDYSALFSLIADRVGVARPGFPVSAGFLSLVSLATEMLTAAGIRLPFDHTQAQLAGRRLFFDTAKTWSELGEPQVTIPTSITDTYEWYVQHGYL
jgi:dihydroflavonol-4-reductase